MYKCTFRKPPKQKPKKEELKKCTTMNASGKKKKQIKEDDIVMICKNVKCFWNEEQNNQFSLPRED